MYEISADLGEGLSHSSGFVRGCWGIPENRERFYDGFLRLMPGLFVLQGEDLYRNLCVT